jgi:NAD(P)-dependent dehydrogenase (short-subunit alcohol dehydrogenase family)
VLGLDLAGRTALVTGATNGLGLEIARLLAARGARVLAGCRAMSRFDTARRRVAASEGGETAARLAPALANLEWTGAVEELGRRLVAEEPPLDFVFLNAGIHDAPHALTADGQERTYAANYLGHFRLLHRLVTAGRLAPAARIVASQSESVHSNPFSWADLDALRAPRSTPLRRLAWRATASPNTKVLLALMAIEYARRVRGTALEGTAFLGGSPGPLRTGNVDQPGLAMALVRSLGPLLLRPAAAGADLLIWVATAPQLAGRSGEVYGRDRRPVRLKRRASDPESARVAWETTERVLSLPAFAPA